MLKRKEGFKNKKILLIMMILTLIVFLNSLGLFDIIENKILDFLIIGDYIFSPDKIDNITLITIDEESINALGEWPLKRDYYSQAIEILNKHQAELIGIDILFTNESNTKEDELFKKSLKKYNNVVLAESANIRIKKNLFKEKIDIIDVKKAIPSFYNNAKSGHINFIADSDGIIRKLSPYLNYNDKKIPAFNLELALNSNKLKNTTLLKDTIVENKNIILNPPFPSGNINEISFIDIINDNFNDNYIEDKLILIGVTEQSLGDSYMTSFSRYGYHSGVEINAFALNNYINNNYIVKSSSKLDLFIFLITVVLLLYGYKLIQRNTDLKLLNNFKFSFMIVITYIIIHLTFFYKQNYYLTFFTPLLLITTIYLIDFSFRYFQQERDIAFIKNTFSRYVSEEIIEELLNNPEKLKLGGEKRKIAILFVDIRSFSEYSKKVSSKKAVEDLNYTFNKLTKIIIKNKGVIDKYLGDGLLAFFGAPVKKDDFVLDAFKTALEIQELSIENKIPFKLGIGLNYGEVIVGNIGSKEKLDYTIIGNAVNGASLYVDRALSNEMILSNMILNRLDEKSREDIIVNENISIWEEMKDEKNYN